MKEVINIACNIRLSIGISVDRVAEAGAGIMTGALQELAHCILERKIVVDDQDRAWVASNGVVITMDSPMHMSPGLSMSKEGRAEVDKIKARLNIP